MKLHGTLVLGATALFLSACGGAGSGSEAAAPALSAPAAAIRLNAPAAVPQTSRISLQWTARGDASTFSVWLKPGDAEDFREVATGLTGRSAIVERGAAWKLDFPTASVRVRGCSADGRCVDSNVQALQDVLLNGIVTLEPQNQVPGVNAFRAVAVSDDGRTVAVGDGGDMPPQWEPGMTAVGSVSVFHRDDTGHWQREAYLIRPYTRLVGARTNGVGEVLALSGDGHTLATKVRESSGAGGIYVFARNAQHQWSEQALLGVGSGELASRLALSFDGNWMAASEVNGFMVYARTGGQWRTDSRVTSPDTGSPSPDWMHIIQATTGLAISGNGKVIAARGTGRASANAPEVFAGVFLYTRCDCKGWTRKAEIRSPRTPGDEHWNSFGSGLALDHEGTMLVVGDPGDPSAAGSPAPNPGDRSAPRSGAVHIYTAQDGGVTWLRNAFLKSSTAPAEDHLGGDVRLSGNGSILSSSACGLDGNSHGVRRNHAAGTGIDWPPARSLCHLRANYVFQRSESGTWRHVAAAIVSAPPNSETLQARSSNAETWVVTALPAAHEGLVGRAFLY